jgi:hypothetical protein
MSVSPLLRVLGDEEEEEGNRDVNVSRPTLTSIHVSHGIFMITQNEADTTTDVKNNQDGELLRSAVFK